MKADVPVRPVCRYRISASLAIREANGHRTDHIISWPVGRVIAFCGSITRCFYWQKTHSSSVDTSTDVDRVSYAYISAVNIKGNLSGKFPSRCLCKQLALRPSVCSLTPTVADRLTRDCLPSKWRPRHVRRIYYKCCYVTYPLLSFLLTSPGCCILLIKQSFCFLFILRSYPDVVSCLERMWNSATRRVALYTETCCTCEHTLRCDNHEKHWRVS